MTRLLVRRLALAVVVALLLAGCGGAPTTPDGAHRSERPTPSAAPTASALPAPSVPATCHLGADTRPDPACTPGTTNPAVTQTTIGQTICTPGWTSTVRPPTSYTGPLKARQIAAYSYTDTDPAGYEEDHLIPLELGGAPADPRNLWPEPHAGGRGSTVKDSAENTLRGKVCIGAVTLDDAQRQILADWGPAVGSPYPHP